MANGSPEYEAGKEAGRQGELLADHTKRLDKINGSIERSATELAGVKDEVHELKMAQERREIAAEAKLEVVRIAEASREKKIADKQRRFQRLVTVFLSGLTVLSTLRALGLS